MNDHPLAQIVERAGPLYPGTVSIVGTGPGDAGLVTIRGAVRISQADVLVHDLYPNSPLWSLVPKQATLLFGGRRDGKPRPKPADFVDLLKPHIDANKRIVRLRNGDPLIFNRTEGEISAYREAGFQVEIVPGITTATAAAACSGVAPTLPEESDAFILTVGRGKLSGGIQSNNQPPESIDYAALARGGTLAIYLAEETAPLIASQLLGAGIAGSTPVMLVADASRGCQRCESLDVKSLSKRDALPSPSMVFIGGGVRGWRDRDWMRDRPLFGRTVLITRPALQSGAFAGVLNVLGAEVLEAPTVCIEPLTDFSEMDDALQNLHATDWVVFQSVHGVSFVMDRLKALGRDARAFGGVQLAAIGPRTAGALEHHFLGTDLVPPCYVGESLVASLIDAGIAGKRIVTFQSDAGRDVVAQSLNDAEAHCTSIVAYRTTAAIEIPADVLQRLEDGTVHWVAFTSPSAYCNFVQLLGDRAERILSTLKLASIGPVTSRVIHESNHVPAVESREQTASALADAIAIAETA